MKKFLFAAIIAVSISASAFAADANKVSSIIRQSFNVEFKHASNVSWKAGADFVKATFTVNNQLIEAFFNQEGEMIATSKTITLSDLPVSAKRKFAKGFADYTVKEAIRFEGTEEKSYYISAENKKETVIVKIGDDQELSIFKKTKK